MLTPDTPFPQQSSWALLEDAGETLAVRIVSIEPGQSPDRRVLVSVPSRLGASGNLTVEFRQLIDATPLSDAERGEYRRLERTIPAAPARRGSRVRLQQERYAALRLRAIHSQTLRSLRAILPTRRFA
jgi:hypothetical protein